MHAAIFLRMIMIMIAVVHNQDYIHSFNRFPPLSNVVGDHEKQNLTKFLPSLCRSFLDKIW